MTRVLPFAAAVLLLAACGSSATSTTTTSYLRPPDAFDFRTQAEKFLRTDASVREQLGVPISTADCSTPASKDVGTTYTCVGHGADGSVWTFGVQITAPTSFAVQTYQRGAS